MLSLSYFNCFANLKLVVSHWNYDIHVQCIYVMEFYLVVLMRAKLRFHILLLYLGVIVSEYNSDNDLKRQMRKFYANAKHVN